jgi:hypothetical protein
VDAVALDRTHVLAQLSFYDVIRLIRDDLLAV